MDFNRDWKFHLKGADDNENYHLIDCNESTFETINLPHDYSITQPYSLEDGAGNTGYKPGGIAWYRKTFEATKEMLEGNVYIEFDGIYNRSTIYFNETFMKFHPYGYSPCLVDITDYIHAGKNTFAVQVDHSRYADSRWYTGSGIYRKVKLHVLPKQHFAVYGVKVETQDVSDAAATIVVQTEIQNATPNLFIKTEIIAPDGSVVATGTTQKSSQTFHIKNPQLWGIFDGKLYTARVALVKNGTTITERNEIFGIRYFHFDKDTGFHFNGENTLIKGVCLHHDSGLVGAAVPKDVWRRRLLALKECGCNAIRTAHNPFSADFMDLCDEMGFLVQEEFYDEWDNPKDKRHNMGEKEVDYISRGHHEFFQEYAKEDLQQVIHRDFNHPCIFQWSIGNEIEWTYPKYVMATGYFGADADGNYFWQEPPYSVEKIREVVSKLPKERYEPGTTAKNLANWTKEIDTTRPVIANMILPSASYESGLADALDMSGFSYRRVVYDRCHEHYSDKPIMGTENVSQWHEWKAVLDRPFISGIFLWTGIDYMGEAIVKGLGWPKKTSASGILDVAGFTKLPYHLFKALWQETPCLHIATQTLEESVYTKAQDGKLVDKEGSAWDKRLWRWEPRNEHWNYTGGEIVVEAYSNVASLTLFVNDKEISTQKLADHEDRAYKWCVPYEAGFIKVVGDGVEEIIYTAKEATKIDLVADKTKITCDLDEVVHIEGLLKDADGRAVTFKEEDVEFIIDGDVVYYGVDNGSPNFVGDHQAKTIPTNNGNVLLIIGGAKAGTVKVSAKVKGNISNVIEIQVTD